MSPTQRTQQFLREQGWHVANCERKIPVTPRGYKGALVTQDLFGFIDTMAFDPNAWSDILAVQSTDDTHHGTRRKKILGATVTPHLARHMRIEVWSWGKRGARGKRKLWTLRRERIALGMNGDVRFYAVYEDKV